MRGLGFFLLPAAMGVLLSLGGCSVPILTQSGTPISEIDGFYADGAADRDLKLLVHGNPFPMPQDGFDRVVETDVQIQTLRPLTHPQLRPDSSAKPNYSLVYVFSPAPTLTGNDLCLGRSDQGPASANTFGAIELPGPAGEETVRVIGAFCVSGLARTEIVGQVQATDAADPRFLDLMRQTMFALFRPDFKQSGAGNNSILVQ